MTRTVFFVFVSMFVAGEVYAQTPPRTAPAAGPTNGGSYYAPKTEPQGPQPIRKVAGEAPLNGPQPVGNPQPGNVIKAPPAGNGNFPGPAANPNPGANLNPAAGANPNPAANPGAAPFQLNVNEQKFVTDLLKTWELRSGQILRFRCEFALWEYDPAFGPKDPKDARRWAKGKINYQTPDKGLFQVVEGKVYVKMVGDKPEYEKQNPELLEHWVCDGKNVFEFDGRNKVLRQRELPPEMQGQAIAEGPLPFLFGAKAEKMMARYWIRGIQNPSQDIKGVYWLEVFPKTRGDASNFQKVHIALDGNDYMPKVLMLFPPNYDAKKNPAYNTYIFDKKESNWNLALDNVKNLWASAFYEPKTPSGWKKVVEPFFGAEPPIPGQGIPGPGAAPNGGQAKKPAVPGTILK